MRGFKIAINMAGAISAGAYTAGVLDFMTEALDAWYRAKAEGAEVPNSEQPPRRAGRGNRGQTSRAVRAHRHHGKHHRHQAAHRARAGSDLRFARPRARLRTGHG